ncbi:hypothetical protein NDU88_005498 [Pleurodeles waltl]|uniref:Uncharacterized protein n=1 Tax=Pleurodeles waltl TaxID=8319 RepID=A0AAV7LSA1_PLEWA|nr:hypothetical protein NDU88_005498 [Pleurodeles waltl]
MAGGWQAPAAPEKGRRRPVKGPAGSCIQCEEAGSNKNTSCHVVAGSLGRVSADHFGAGPGSRFLDRAGGWGA